jgi:septum formation protein
MGHDRAKQPGVERLILASASPRRRELLRYLDVPFEAVATDGEDQDILPPPEMMRAFPPFPHDRSNHPTILAWRKVNAAIEAGVQGLILGADTIVVIAGTILNKPRDPADARRMLRLLAGKTHTVYTGVALLDTDAPSVCAMELVSSDVTIAPLTDGEIADYVATGEPLDKAGAYGIQGLGGRLVQAVSGSYTSVVGLPLVTIYQLLTEHGVERLAAPIDAFRRWLADQGKDLPACIAP